ncbi:hypothetical protein BH09CHL1_BH09CHL1_06110 [soil metagenome]
MAELSVPSPVFVIGTLRSGASLLSLALGQHQQVQQVLHNPWVEEFTIGLIRSFRAASRSKAISQVDINGIELDAFFARFGETALALMSPSGPLRPILLDSTPANLFLVTPLRMLFPTAKFIHVVRGANEVIESLTNKQLAAVYKSRYIECSLKEAQVHWMRGVRAGLDAERAYGSTIVQRVQRDDLVSEPAETLRNCFRFLGLEFDQAALRPFSSISAATSSSVIVESPDVYELEADLLQTTSPFPGDDILDDRLKGETWQKATRSGRLVPPMPGSFEAINARRKRERHEAKPLVSRLVDRLAHGNPTSGRGST